MTLSPGKGAAGVYVRVGNAVTGRAGLEEGHEVMNEAAMV